jgi:hypothetical protein
VAKLNPANLAPDALLRIRDVVISRISRGVIIAQKWPRKRGPSKTDQQVFLTQQFARASRMAANSEPMQVDTARFLSSNTVWLPRDLLVRAAYGNVYELTAPDGTKAYQTNHGYSGIPQRARPLVMNWQPNQNSGALTATNSTTAFAFKGTGIVPDTDMTLNGLQVVLTPVVGGTYLPICCELNGANVIQSIVAGTPRTLATITKKVWEFQITAPLTQGVRYAIMVGRTNGVAAYVLPLVGSTNGTFMAPLTQLGAARIASINPAIGNTVTVNSADFCMSLLLDF